MFSDLTVKMSETYHKMVKIWTTIGFDSNQIESRSCIFADNITVSISNLFIFQKFIFLNKFNTRSTWMDW